MEISFELINNDRNKLLKELAEAELIIEKMLVDIKEYRNNVQGEVDTIILDKILKGEENEF